MKKNIYVENETGFLRKLLIHSPDSGLGKVVPSKAQDWLFEDIVHLDTIRKKEYDLYIQILLYFLDPEIMKNRGEEFQSTYANRDIYQPEKPSYFNSDKVIELQRLLMDILKISNVKEQLVASVCALESCSYAIQQQLLKLNEGKLAKVFLSGVLSENQMIFPPVPNFIFTRDIGIVIHDHILLNKPKKEARKREALLAKYIFHHHPLFENHRSNIIELEEFQNHFLLPTEEQESIVTIEGGDVMMVAPGHVMIGVSERTSQEAASEATKVLFEKNVVQKVSIVKIPKKRDYMHIDTVFTQVKKNVWVILGEFAILQREENPYQIIDHSLGEKSLHLNSTEVIQFIQNLDGIVTKRFDCVESLLRDICVEDLGCRPEEVNMVYSGNKKFPYDVREQWTDSCNLLAIKDGVALAYDRNDHTLEAFKEIGFSIMEGEELLEKFRTQQLSPENLEDTIIIMPSAELSRARGGFHCMSMPLLRDSLH